jgi:DNA-directed RNA polymerase subunit RPC12/RpoP
MAGEKCTHTKVTHEPIQKSAPLEAQRWRCEQCGCEFIARTNEMKRCSPCSDLGYIDGEPCLACTHRRKQLSTKPRCKLCKEHTDDGVNICDECSKILESLDEQEDAECPWCNGEKIAPGSDRVCTPCAGTGKIY